MSYRKSNMNCFITSLNLCLVVLWKLIPEPALEHIPKLVQIFTTHLHMVNFNIILPFLPNLASSNFSRDFTYQNFVYIILLPSSLLPV